MPFLFPLTTTNIHESVPLVDWLVENSKKFGATLHIVTNASPEGSQFCAGFGGLGAILRYPMEPPADEDELFDDFIYDEDEDSGSDEAF